MQVKETSNRGGASRWAGRALALLATLVALGGPLVAPARADFVLWNDEQLTVDSYHAEGTIHDQSRLEIVSGGFVDNLYVLDSSAADVSGGEMRVFVASDSSTVNIFGGSVTALGAWLSSTVNISSNGAVYSLVAYDSNVVDVSGGTLDMLDAYGFTSVGISGGSVGQLVAYESSTVIFDGWDFQLSGGLSLDGDRVLGTGYLNGQWLNGTPWQTHIIGNSVNSVIRIIPEPATLALLGMGLAGLLRRRRR